jgi:D-inositol-3-phosphate glycosyltransferase
MKILIVTHYFHPHIGGIEIIVRNQAKELVKKGDSITLVTSKLDGDNDEEQIEGIKVIRVKAWNWLEKKYNIPFPIFSFKLFITLAKEMKNVDIIHINDIFYTTSIIAGIYALFFKKKLYLTQHVALVSYPNKIIEYIQYLFYVVFGKLIFHISNKVITYNSHVTEFLIKIGVNKEKIIELKNGINQKIFSPIKQNKKHILRKIYNIPVNKKVVLFVGRLVPKKGVDILFNAKDDSYTVLFVGSGSIPAEMKKAKNVIFLGQIDQDEMDNIYKLSDVFVLPTTGEVFPLVIQEAMACGLPIITTYNIGYDKFNINKQLFLLTSRTTIDIKNNIQNILSKKSLYSEMAKYSLSFSRKYFDLNKNIDDFKEIYL